MEQKRSIFTVMAMVVFGCLVMAIVDGIIMPGYTIKSIIKLALFLALPLAYLLAKQKDFLGELFRLQNRRSILEPLFLGLGVYALIVSGFFLGKNLVDWSSVASSLKNSRENIFAMGAYICIINSLLEEFFFRGFAFLMLSRFAESKIAYLFSAGLFSLYHIAIMQNWFSPLVFALLLAGLFFSGLIFNWLSQRYQNIYAPWIVHICSNLAINTVGLVLIME